MADRDLLSVIEVGSKGVRLLIARREPIPLGMSVLQARGKLGLLGEGLSTGRDAMRRDNIERTLYYVRQFLKESEHAGVADVVLVGTEVFRRAVNTSEFVAGLPSGLLLRVLQPAEEAVASFLAACWGFRATLATDERLLLLDLGGGSLEIVAGVNGNPPRPRVALSLPAMGTLALRDFWPRGASRRQREAILREHFDSVLGPNSSLLEQFGVADSEAQPVLAVGLGSTAIDSAWIWRHGSRTRFRSAEVHGLRTTRSELVSLRQRILNSRWQGANGLAEEIGVRELMGFQLGLAALTDVMQRLKLAQLMACGTGLRYGLAYALLHDIPLAVADR